MRTYDRYLHHYKVAYTFPIRREDASGNGYYDKDNPHYQEREVRIIGPFMYGQGLVESWLRIKHSDHNMVLKTLVKLSEPLPIDGEVHKPSER